MNEAEQAQTKGNSEDKPKQETKGQQRVVSNPNEVANLVLMQIDAVNAKKDDLTTAVKGLADLTKQLVRAYAENMKVIQALQAKVKELEDKENQ